MDIDLFAEQDGSDEEEEPFVVNEEVHVNGPEGPVVYLGFSETQTDNGIDRVRGLQRFNNRVFDFNESSAIAYCGTCGMGVPRDPLNRCDQCRSFFCDAHMYPRGGLDGERNLCRGCVGGGLFANVVGMVIAMGIIVVFYLWLFGGQS